jgi:hypothetical protein
MRSTILGNRTRGDRPRLHAALRATGLESRDMEPAAHLSGGEKQRLAVARAIYKDAQVIYVDEPTASLDDRNRHAVIALFTALARGGCTVIVATHDAAVMGAADTRHELHLEPRRDPSDHGRTGVPPHIPAPAPPPRPTGESQPTSSPTQPGPSSAPGVSATARGGHVIGAPPEGQRGPS